MLRVAPMRQHSPTMGMEMLLGVPPLELYFQHLAASTFHGLNLQPHEWDGKLGSKYSHIKWIEKFVADDLPHSDLQDSCVTQQ
jgi:hypothetical protein